MVKRSKKPISSSQQVLVAFVVGFIVGVLVLAGTQYLGKVSMTGMILDDCQLVCTNPCDTNPCADPGCSGWTCDCDGTCPPTNPCEGADPCITGDCFDGSACLAMGGEPSTGGGVPA